jgi:hypothetical protein
MQVAKLVLAAGAAILIAPVGAAAEKPSYGCAGPFTEVTIEDAIQLERTQLAIADGLLTSEDAEAGYNFVDKNGDGVICYTRPHGAEKWNAPYGEYLYNFVDNSASARR